MAKTPFYHIYFSTKTGYKIVEVCTCGCPNNSTLLAIVSELCDFIALAAVEQLEPRWVSRAGKQEKVGTWEKASLCVSHERSLPLTHKEFRSNQWKVVCERNHHTWNRSGFSLWNMFRSPAQKRRRTKENSLLQYIWLSHQKTSLASLLLPPREQKMEQF